MAATFKLTGPALRDVASLIGHLHRQRGAAAANGMESKLLHSFHVLGREPSAGHPRTDLTARKLLFHSVPPYMVVFRRKKERVEIVRVLHGSRNIKHLL